MRMLFAKLLVVVTGLLIIMLAILFAVIRNASEASAPRPSTEVGMPAPEIGVAPRTSEAVVRPQAAILARGSAVYVEQRCPMCHSLDGEGNTRSPLDNVSRRLTEKEIRLWIVAPQEMNAAVEFAVAAPYPDPSKVHEDVYA